MGKRKRTKRVSSLLSALAIALMAAVVMPAAADEAQPDDTAAKVNYWKDVNPVTELTAESFAKPPTTDMPWVRWNWSPAVTTNEQLESDLEKLAAAGISGAEIGQGGNPTNEQLKVILEKANSLGITIGIKYKGGAPINGTWVNTADYTRTTLNNSRTIVNGGASFNGTLPGNGTIVAVVAYKCASGECESSGARVLDRSSAIDLTKEVVAGNTNGFYGGPTAGTLEWSAPDGSEQWALITFRATAVQAEPELLSKEGTDALIAGYEDMWTPELKELLAKNRSDIFVDSHATDPWGTATDLWSSNITEEFEGRVGYNLIPDLASLFYADYKYTDGTDEKVRTDFYQVRNDLFIENRITPFTEYLHGHGMTLRLQPEDPNIGGADIPFQDQIDMAYYLERPEHESLVGDQIDIWRPITSGIDWNGNPWYSKECCAVRSMNYVETLQDVAARMNKAYASGMTRNVYHVYPTEYSPTSTFPGYANFGLTSFSGSWGPRNPNWESDGLQFNTALARNQQVLTQGRGDVDVAVYLHSFEWQSGAESNTDGSEWTQRYWKDLGLQSAGYTWNYVNPTLLDTPEAKVTDGILHADGPSYKAFVINTGIQTPNHPKKYAMPVDTAKKVLDLAKDGLPIVIVGELPKETPGNNGDDAALVTVIDELAGLPGVHRVETEADVPVKLAELDIAADASSDESVRLMTRHRHDAATSTDYYFLYNQSEERANWDPDLVYEEPEACRYTGSATPCRKGGSDLSTEVTLTGTGVPYFMDVQSGKISPITQYSTGEGTVTVRVDLASEESKIIALSDVPNRFGIDVPDVHVVSTTGDFAEVVNGKVVIHASKPGDYTAELSNGETVSGKVEAALAKIDLTDATWALEVEDWKNAHPFGTTGQEGAAFSKDTVEVTLDGLKAWPDIPELKDTSGVGRYFAEFNLETWTPGNHAVLSLGQVVDTFAVKVNGTDVPMDTIGASADVGPYLTEGKNTLEVRVSTTLNNRLAQLAPAVQSRGVIQEYGLVGPVTLTPTASVSSDLEGSLASVSITHRMVAGKVYLVVSMTNNSDGPIDLSLSTPYGTKVFEQVASGKTVSAAQNSRLTTTPSGEVEVEITATIDGETVTSTVTESYPEF